MSITKTVPVGTENKEVNFYLAIRKVSYLRSARQPNYQYEWLTKPSYKSMPGYPFVGLGCLADTFRRADLRLYLPFIHVQKLRAMNEHQQQPTQAEILRQLLLATKDQLLKVSFFNQELDAPTVTFSINTLNVVCYAN